MSTGSSGGLLVDSLFSAALDASNCACLLFAPAPPYPVAFISQAACRLLGVGDEVLGCCAGELLGLQATLEDVVQHHPQEDLQHLLVAGLACAQEAISVLEVSPHAFDDPAAVAALQDGHETDGDTHLPPQHSNSAAFSDGRPSSSLDMHRYHMEHPSALRTNLCRIVYANPALEALMGRSSADLYDLSCLISPDTDLQDIQALQHALRDRRPATVKILCSRPSGAFWMTLSLSPIHHTFPFRSAAWVPGSMPPTPGGARSVAGDDFSRSCSSDLVPGGGQGRQQHQSYMRSNTPDMCNAVAEALEAVRGSQRQGGQPGEVTAHITCAASEAGGGPPGGPLHYLCVFQDMTEQIRQKEEERRLLEAKVAAETATEAKSMFLANMSHEIRTPLNGMMATAQLLLSSSLTPEQQELAETVLESGNTLLGILGDILDFSKLDNGAIELHEEPMCLRSSIEACIELVAPDALKKGLSLSYSADPSAVVAPLMADPIRLRQVLTNLLSNAVKFTDRGEVHVELVVEDLPPDQAPDQAEAATTAQSTTGGSVKGAGGGSAAGDHEGMHPRTHSTLHLLMRAGTPEARDSQLTQQTSHITDMDAASDAGSDDTAYTAEDDGEGGPSMSCPLPALLRRPSADGSVSSAPLLNMYNPNGTPHDGQGPMARWYSSSPQSMRGSIDIPDMGGDDDHDGAWPGADRDWTEPNSEASSSTFTRLGAHSLPGNLEAGGQAELPSHPAAGPSSAAQGSSSTGRRVRISVRDTGIGIAPELIGRLFESFRQGTETMSRRYGGTGLGLAISRRLAQLMKGTVWVQSGGKGKGSTFHFCIPATFSPPSPAPKGGHSSRHGLSRVARAAGEGASGSGGEELREAESPRTPRQMPITIHGSTTMGHISNVGPTAVFRRPPEEWRVLRGRRVLVDISHTGTSLQVCQSCQTLGMTAQPGDSASPQSGARDQFDIAVVSTERVGAALRAGWKGRPLVAVGARASLHQALLPLVVMVTIPVAHARLAHAMVKSMVLLRWGSGSKGAPNLTARLAAHPPSAAQLQEFVNWREKGRGAEPLFPAAAGVEAEPAGADGGMGGAVQPGGNYLGGQLAVPVPGHLRSGFAHAAGAPVRGGTGGFLMPGFGYALGGAGGAFGRPFGMIGGDPRRSSLDNSSLDRARVQQALAWGEARNAAIAAAPKGQFFTASAGTGASPSQGGSPREGATSQPPAEASSSSSGAAGGAPTATPGSSRRSLDAGQHHAMPHLGSALPHAIPEDTVFHSDSSRESSQVSIPLSAASGYTSSPAAPSSPAPAHRPPPAPIRTGKPQPPPANPASSGAGAAAAAAGSGGAKDLPPLRILIAEDNKVNQKVVLKVLQHIAGGCQPDVVENGVEVLKAVERKHYDLLLLDIHMPEMDGLEATRRIVATYPPERRPRIIALSADTLSTLHDKCREAGIAEFLVKPFRVEDLKRVMQTCGRVMPPLPGSSTTTSGAAGGASGAAHMPRAGSSNALGTGAHAHVGPAAATTASS